MMKNYQGIVSIALIFLSLFALIAEAGNLYRYRNHEGNLVIDYAVPPQYVAKGYEILSESGTVIEVIKPQVDPADLEPMDVQRRRLEAEAAQRKEDEMLLRTYSDVAELEAAMDRKLAQLDREIKIVRTNLGKNEKALNASRTKAANYQLGGRHVPKALLKNMDNQIDEKDVGENMLLVRQQEYQSTKNRYLEYLDRLKTLKGSKDSANP